MFLLSSSVSISCCLLRLIWFSLLLIWSFLSLFSSSVDLFCSFFVLVSSYLFNLFLDSLDLFNLLGAFSLVIWSFLAPSYVLLKTWWIMSRSQSLYLHFDKAWYCRILFYLIQICLALKFWTFAQNWFAILTYECSTKFTGHNF